MQTVELKTGKLLFPDDFEAVLQTKTDDSDYAAVIAEKNGTIPHFIVFSDHTFFGLSEECENAVYDLLEKYRPEIKEIRSKEVEAVWDGNHHITNAEEWDAAPRLGFFPIPDVKNNKNLYLGTGILRG